MNHNNKRAQTKDYKNILLPKSNKKGKVSRVILNKNNKDTINKVISRNKNDILFLNKIMKLKQLIS